MTISSRDIDNVFGRRYCKVLYLACMVFRCKWRASTAPYTNDYACVPIRHFGHKTDVPPNRDLCATSTRHMPWDFHVFDILPKRGVATFIFLPETYRSGCDFGVENPHLEDSFSFAIVSVKWGKCRLNLSQACLTMKDINCLGINLKLGHWHEHVTQKHSKRSFIAKIYFASCSHHSSAII